MVQNIELNMIPNAIPAVAYASQLDTSRTFTFTLYEGTEAFTIPDGASVTINGKKNDSTIFIYTEDDGVVSWTGNVVTISTTMQMTAVAGDTLCQIRVDDGNGKNLGSVEFTLSVTEMPGADEEGISQSALPSIITQATAQMEAAAQSASDAQDYMEQAEIYKNNALQAANRADESASDAKDSADAAEASAQTAAAWSAHPPYIGENGNWWVYNTTTNVFVDSGIDASITIQIADITMLDYGVAPYVTNTGTNTDTIFHLFIPRGAKIASIEKTASSGLVDTYTITMEDGGAATFTVTNGKTAYQSAVEGGFSGTEEEFESALANFETWKNEASEAATEAAEFANDAAASADEAEHQAELAAFYADYTAPQFTIENNRIYVKTDANVEFMTANNRLYVKVA